MKGQNVNELKNLILQAVKQNTPIQTSWAKVKSVDWDNKVMICTGIKDELDYEGVLLGLGGFYMKPKIGQKCLVGIVENQGQNAFLISAEATEELAWENDVSTYRITKDGFEIKKGDENLKDVLNDFIDEVNKIVVVTGTTINQAKVILIKERLNTILI